MKFSVTRSLALTWLCFFGDLSARYLLVKIGGTTTKSLRGVEAPNTKSKVGGKGWIFSKENIQ